MGDCDKVIEYLKQALTPGEIELIEDYVERYGSAIGIAVLIVDALRGNNKAQKGSDMFSAIFDEINKMVAMAIQQALSSMKHKIPQNDDQVLVQVLDPQEILNVNQNQGDLEGNRKAKELITSG